MKQGVNVIVLLLILCFTLPALAFTPKGIVWNNDTQAVAWLEDDVLFVAIANTQNMRERFTIESTTGNRSSHNVIQPFNVLIPGFTVAVESIPLTLSSHPRWSEDLTEIIVDGRSLGRLRVPVQQNPALGIDNYVVEANKNFDVNVDLFELVGGRSFSRISVDDDYQMLTSRHTGRINIIALEGGITSSRNEVFFRKSTMTLRMRTPNIKGVGMLTFDFSYVQDDNSWKNRVDGPLFLVYGSDMRLIDNTSRVSPSTPPGRVYN